MLITKTKPQIFSAQSRICLKKFNRNSKIEIFIGKWETVAISIQIYAVVVPKKNSVEFRNFDIVFFAKGRD